MWLYVLSSGDDKETDPRISLFNIFSLLFERLAEAHEDGCYLFSRSRALRIQDGFAADNSAGDESFSVRP